MHDAGLTCVASIPDNVKLQDAIPRNCLRTAEVTGDGRSEFRGHSLCQGNSILTEDDAFAKNRARADLPQCPIVVTLSEPNAFDPSHLSIGLRLWLGVLMPSFPLCIALNAPQTQGTNDCHVVVRLVGRGLQGVEHIVPDLLNMEVVPVGSCSGAKGAIGSDVVGSSAGRRILDFRLLEASSSASVQRKAHLIAQLPLDRVLDVVLRQILMKAGIGNSPTHLLHSDQLGRQSKTVLRNADSLLQNRISGFGDVLDPRQCDVLARVPSKPLNGTHVIYKDTVLDSSLIELHRQGILFIGPRRCVEGPSKLSHSPFSYAAVAFLLSLTALRALTMSLRLGILVS